ncbi:MAG: hypothetical protein LBV52_05000 [Spirochaetaceae bacterium]|nr:hypothetical protein [Spirochaetaceae bacterium]
MARIVTVKSVEPIAGKDRIQKLYFEENGYSVIGDKSFAVGQQVIFVEADSLLPLRPCFEFLRDRCYKEKYNRFLIKPMKMCGVISMGIVFNTDIIERRKNFKSGEDLTKLLDIIKYEPEDNLSQKTQTPKFIKYLLCHKSTRPIGQFCLKLMRKFTKQEESGGAFPGHLIEKSDETTIQNCPEILETHKNTLSYATIKMEGQSCTFLYDYKNRKIKNFFVCSRTRGYIKRSKTGRDDGTAFWNTANDLEIPDKIMHYYKKTGKLLALQGERCGPSVQKNVYKFDRIHFFIYTARDLITNNYLTLDEMLDFARTENLETVPVIEEWKNIPLCEIISDSGSADAVSARYFALKPEGLDLQYKLKSGEKPAFAKNGIYFHEGIVVRGMAQEFSFKVKNPDYAYWFCS